MKERVTITIENNLLQEIDSQIDGTIIKNRSHAIELALSKCFQKKTLNQAVILAGGKYTIKQDGRKIPTFMVRINGKPILEHNIAMLKRQGITKFYLAVGFKKELIEDYFGTGEQWGIHIKYIKETEPQGTSGVLHKIGKYINSPFVMCNGDELKDINIKEMFEFHKKQGALATIAVTTTTNPENYGVVVLNGNKVYSFIEKPKTNIPTNLINAGLYIFEPEVIQQAPLGFGRLEQDVFPKLVQKEKLSGYVFYGKWQDVRDEEALEKAMKNW